MLYPQRNKHRNVLDLSGIWRFRADPDRVGECDAWYNHFEAALDIAVPGSWNEQLEANGLLHYVGPAWYQSNVLIPLEFAERVVWLRIGSADYAAKLWVNGNLVGEHSGGFVPFEFDITSLVQPGCNASIVLMVTNELDETTIPQGISPKVYQEEKRLREETYPATRFDFFPFGGIHRPVILYSTPPSHISCVKADTRILPGGGGSVRVRIEARNAGGLSVRATLQGCGWSRSEEDGASDDASELCIAVDACRPWTPSDPHLYSLLIELTNGAETVDSYELNVGIREVAVDGNRLLLNGEPVYLKGFGKHEDFPVIGKGLCLPLMVKDFGLLKWINANSFRTSHYPYAEEMMSMADRLGFLVIDEVPAVSLDLRRATGATLANHKKAIRELFERDYNHPSVVMWALGNEPNLVGDEAYLSGIGRDYWREVFSYARTLDATRPMTVPNCSGAGNCDPVFEFSDVLTINRYFGWYEYPGRLEHAASMICEEIDALYRRYGKPLMMTEFGVDTMSGMHSLSDQMFTEEYQTNFLEAYIRALRSREFVVGEHVWNFADFRTPQHFRRVVMNMKGVFTRDRQPKAAAFRLKDLWGDSFPEPRSSGSERGRRTAETGK